MVMILLQIFMEILSNWCAEMTRNSNPSNKNPEADVSDAAYETSRALNLEISMIFNLKSKWK